MVVTQSGPGYVISGSINTCLHQSISTVSYSAYFILTYQNPSGRDGRNQTLVKSFGDFYSIAELHPYKYTEKSTSAINRNNPTYRLNRFLKNTTSKTMSKKQAHLKVDEYKYSLLLNLTTYSYGTFSFYHICSHRIHIHNSKPKYMASANSNDSVCNAVPTLAIK